MASRRNRTIDMPAPYLRRVWLDPSGIADRAAYPFCLPYLQDDFELSFDRSITIIVGENGTGKSTFLEGIAVLAGYDEAGGGQQGDPSGSWWAIGSWPGSRGRPRPDPSSTSSLVSLKPSCPPDRLFTGGRTLDGNQSGAIVHSPIENISWKPNGLETLMIQVYFCNQSVCVC